MATSTIEKARLTAAEVAVLWELYMIESLLIQVKQPMLAGCRDPDVRALIQTALEMSVRYVEDIRSIYRKEQYPFPEAFSEKDRNVEAPPLFSDVFILHYTYGMAKLGLRTVPHAIGESARGDVLDFLYRAYDDYRALFQKAVEMLLNKGLYTRAASFPIPDQTEFIREDRYFAGWLGKQRPLNASEIRALHFTIEQNVISKALLTGFRQTVRDEEIREYMGKGIRMAERILDNLGETLGEEHIGAVPSLDDEVYVSNIAPYTDKLMLAHVAQMGSGAISIYGTYLSTVHRRDIGLQFVKLIEDGMKYASEGVELMIRRRWLEQPPTWTEPGALGPPRTE
ncbi:DUF3231 family protein [Paenibacillus sp.]|uniref:DUF3231 family protein n=1 Tax=Paenibacillus sp. TaxID=58172 RepID=UPI002D444E30|nr:DUF3231 family protein [Paenibacillus sp.]HZG57349.1 DUF3231 family protein [Paenibacillus sp.]